MHALHKGAGKPGPSAWTLCLMHALHKGADKGLRIIGRRKRLILLTYSPTHLLTYLLTYLLTSGKGLRLIGRRKRLILLTYLLTYLLQARGCASSAVESVSSYLLTHLLTYSLTYLLTYLLQARGCASSAVESVSSAEHSLAS